MRVREHRNLGGRSNGTMRSPLLYALISALLLLSSLPAAAQITTTVNVRTPTPPRISEWQRDATIIQIFLVNSSATEFRNTRLSFFIRDVETGRVVARTDDAHPQMPRFTIPARGSLSLNGPQVIRQEAVDIDASIERLAITTGELPEGTYEYCAEVISETGASLSTAGPACRTFRIIFPDPPDLIYPIENTSIAGTPYPVFRWTPVVHPGTAVQYRVVVKARLEGQNARQALETNGRSLTLFEGTVPTNSYSWLPSDRRFDDPTLRTSRFVWQVQSVSSATGEPIGRNNGFSSIGEFNNGSSASGSSGTMELTPHFPLDNDTIPWQVPHMIVRWGAFDPDINRMTYTLTVRDASGGVVGTNSRTLNWSGGILESQGVATIDRARLIIVSFTDACESPGWMNSLRRGSRYTWSVEATFRRTDGSQTSLTSPTASFVTGLRAPENREPSDGAVIAPGSQVTLRWRAPEPRQGDFQPTELLTRYRNQACMQFSYAFEEMKLEVSRRSDFSTTVATDRISLPGDRPQLVTGEDLAPLYALQSYDLGRPGDTGTYFWRVSYLDESGSTYATGPTWQFRIGSGTGSGDDGGDVTAEECIRMIPGSPERDGTWTAGRRPLFSVLTRPVVDLDAVTGGRLRIWRMNAATEDTTEVMRRSTEFDQSFGRSDVSTALRAGSSMEGMLPIDIPLVNESGSRYTFEGDSGASYLWTFTLEYDGSRIRGDSISCSRSVSSTIPARFTIGDGGGGSSDSGACADVCSRDSVTDRTPSTRSFRNGDEIDVGRFRMRLTRVSGSGGALSGEGEIAVPFLNNVKIQVSFSGISVNGSNRMYAGRINAKHDPTSPLSEEDANRLSGALGITEGESQSLNSLVSDAGRLVSFLSGSSMSLPLGFDNVVEGERIVVGIVGMVFTATDARFNATAYVDVAELGPGVGFGLQARDICFHPGGIGGDGRAILALANDHGYREPGAWSFLFKAPSASDSGTAIAFDCNGFSWLRLHAEVEFPKEWMTKAEPVNAADTGLVTASFITTIRRTGDFIAHATMDPFAPTDAPDLKIAVEDIVLDLSNHDNPVGIAFPTNFRGDRTNRFRGFYIRRASVALPEALRTFDSTRPMRLEANNLIIDFRGGFNFNLDLVNVIQYPRGDFGGWGASIDTLGISFVNSSLENGHMSGRLKLPISDSALDYRATLGAATRDTASSGPDSTSGGGGLQFTFSIVPRDTIRADLWAASMRLNPTSRIDLRAGGGRDFYIGATLSGSIGITGDVGGVPGLNFTNMEFENMRLQSVEPYFDPGRWPNNFAHASPQHSTAGFPVSISNLNIVTGERDRGFGAGIQFTLSVNISGGGEGEEGTGNAISGGTTLSIWGVLVNDGGGQNFEFDGVDLDSVGVAADLGAVQIAGGIRLYRRDPTFGTGFRGALSATFVKQVTVNVTAQFGSVGEGEDEYRYWYVDALARFEPGFMIFTGVGIYGFGGGAWYHMRKESMSAAAEQAMLASATTGGSVNADSANPGGTNSGYRFVPDRGEAFGFRAMVTLGTFPKPDAFNADVYFEMTFLEGGGVGRITIGGDGFIMAGLNERSQAKVTANAEMTYNFPAETFDGHFRFSINANPLTGGGEIVMHASPRTWFFKAGTPDRRITVSLADWIEINTYLMVGKDLPFPMSLPPEIREVLGEIPPMRSPAITQGDGFAFGAMASFEFDPPPFLIFYAEIAFTLGFDLGLLNNGNAAICEESGEPMGVNGWYALGQFYAYMRGSMGIEVDLFFVNGKFEIFGFEIAALLRGGAPNPAWLQGIIAGSYRLFGGAIQGNCRYEFEVGEECTPMRENPLAELGLVSDLQPADGTRDVPFDVEPRAAFNFNINDRFDITEMRDDGTQRVRTFRVRVQDFTLDERRGSGWSRVGSTYRLISRRSQASLIPNRGLKGEVWHRARVAAYGEEYTRGSWRIAQKLDGTPVNDIRTVQFLTAPLPDTIIPSNVRIAYPRDRQRYFLQDECPTGSIDLHREVDYLFAATPPNGFRYTYHARFVPLPSGTPPIEVDARYRSFGSTGRIEYTMPDLPNDQIFALQIIRRRVSTRTSTLPTLGERRDYAARHSATSRYGSLRTRMTLQAFLREWNVDSNSLTQRDRRVTGFQMSRQTAPTDDLLLVYNFRTSRYDRLAQKLNALSFTEVRNYPPFGIVELQDARQSGAELFDIFDLDGKSYVRYGRRHRISPLVGVEANRRIRNWHTRYTNPWIYDVLDIVERLRRRNITTNFERQVRRRRLAAYVRGASGELSDHEISPPPPSSGGGSGSGGTRFAGVGSRFTGRGWSPPAFVYTPMITYAYRHGTTIPLDYFLMRREVARQLACCAGEFMSSADERKLRQALARPYVMMYKRSEYGIDFYYNYCYDPDTPPRRIEERFRLP